MVDNTEERWNVALLRDDMDRRGWNNLDLAKKSKPELHHSQVNRFLSGEVQTSKTALAIAKAFGHKTADRYLIPRHKESAA